MPFKKIGENKNQSPSGKVFTDKQVRYYYATDGFTRSQRIWAPRSGGILSVAEDTNNTLRT